MNFVFVIFQLARFARSAKEERQSFWDHTKDPFSSLRIYEDIRGGLVKEGIPVEDVDLDTADFKNWLEDFHELHKYYRFEGRLRIEKCLEHYLIYRYLDIATDDVYIDVAAAKSPWAEILNKKGIISYKLDASYSEGMHGIKIGADAVRTGLPEAFAGVISMQCAYECLSGEKDIKFFKEADRILKRGGRCGIVPVYLDTSYFIARSPCFKQRSGDFDRDAKMVWREDYMMTPFARHYSSGSFAKRAYSNLPDGMTGKMLYFRNLYKVMEEFTGQKLYCFFMFRCDKGN
jgi:hypothetical protein